MNSDSESGSRSISVRHGQSLALRPGNALVTRGLQDIVQFANRARAKELYELGKACSDKFEDDQAIAYYTEAIRLDPELVEAYCERGEAYEYSDDFARAVVDCTEAIRLDPENARAYKLRGDACFGFVESCEGPAQAVAYYTEAIRLDPKYADAYSARARAYFLETPSSEDHNWDLPCDATGCCDRAIADLTEAIRLDPSDSGDYERRGDVYQYMGEQAKAIADYTQVIRPQGWPWYGGAYQSRGMAYLKKGDYHRAIADFTVAIRRGWGGQRRFATAGTPTPR